MAKPLADVGRALHRVRIESRALVYVTRAGMLGPTTPHKLLNIYRALTRYGVLGGSIMIAALRHGRRVALRDDAGAVSFRDLDERSNALANSWRERGLGEGSGLAILCRNHRGLLDATFATAKIGGRALYLNTEFSGPQAAAVCGREGAEAIVYDDDFAGVVAGVDAPKGRFVAWGSAADGAESLETLIATGDPKPPRRPTREGAVILLTSGTTGTPKGAPRSQPKSLVLPAGILSRIPFRGGGATLVASPMFHAWGFLNALITVSLGSTLVVQRHFDPERALEAAAENDCTAIVVVPVMLQRFLTLGEERIRALDLSKLRIIASSGSQLDGALAARTTRVFGDVLYNLYGSTEVAYASIATPTDLRDAPGCVGRAPFGTRLRILDADGREVEDGEIGRVFVGSSLVFEGYTGGDSKEVVDGFMSTGDVGHFDGRGILHLDGRDDEMIVSGGENVFPREVEELLATHDAVLDVAAIGVPDDQFGQRLRCFVVVRSGQQLGADEVKDFARSNLARYKVPRDVVFVEALPRNPTGKVLKRELAALPAE